MKKNYWLAIAAVGSITALALTGCSASGTATGGKTTLTVQDYYADAQAAQMSPIFESCATDNGVKLNNVHVPSDGYMAKVLQQLSSKTLPDVLMLDNPNVQQIAASGALAPLDDFGVSGEGFAHGAVAAGSFDGKLYALPPVVNSISLFYNVDILKAAGITPPTTWAELQADAKALTSGSQYGFAFSAVNNGEGTWTFLPFMWSNGGDEKNINTPQTAQALQFLTDLVKDGSASKSVVNWTQADVNDQFLAGKTAMMINGPWQIPALNKSGVKWASVSIPTRTADQKVQSPLGGETFGAAATGNKASTQKAADFVKCVTDGKSASVKAKNELAVPALTAAADEFAKANPDLASFVKIVQTARARTAELGEKWAATETALAQALQSSLTGQATPEDALATAAAGLK